ncbi:hypothetical protein [Peptacetobacter sp.]|uniref:hypothetical protein n=1 Tax=Peptacetobacter sp. TaxID=2991975 RepID=UPI002634B26B|nr:hypothetical protein [Peptacetobacter sp.]
MINYKIVFVVILFMILVSIQFVLNKIYLELKEIKNILYKQNIEEILKRNKEL